MSCHILSCAPVPCCQYHHLCHLSSLLQEEGFIDPQVASLAFQVDSMVPSSSSSQLHTAVECDDRSSVHTLPARCYSINESLCTMVVALAKPMASEQQQQQQQCQQEELQPQTSAVSTSSVLPVKNSAKKVYFSSHLPCCVSSHFFLFINEESTNLSYVYCLLISLAPLSLVIVY